MPEVKSKEIEKILELAYTLDKNRVSVEDFVVVVKVLTKYAKETRDITAKEIENIDRAVEVIKEKIVDENGVSLLNAKEVVEKRLNKALADFDKYLKKSKDEQREVVSYMYDRATRLKDGYTPQKGVDYFDGKQGKDGSPDSPEQIRDKLEQLAGDGRLSQSAIKDLEERLKALEERPTGTGGGGRKGVTLYVNGAKKLLTAQTINITGTGVTYNYANGRNDITITGGASLSVLTATGTVNDTNTAFTFASEPTLVVVNGATYRHGAGVTISGTSVTLDNPVGVGGDIYALG